MCLFPVTIKSVDSFGLLTNQSVPCGKCIECMKDKQNSWKIRLTEESKVHKYVYFFTLTYNDDSVPFYNDSTGVRCLSVRKRDVQLWIKRNRMCLHRSIGDFDFKYFVCSEYGPNTGRPHYHGIFFTDISPTLIRSFFNDWRDNYGFYDYSLVGRSNKTKTRSSPSAVGNYVAKYCCKPKVFMSDAEKKVEELIKTGFIEKTWLIMSKGIGESYVHKMRWWHVPNIDNPRQKLEKVVDRMVYKDGKFDYKLPRFYKDRLYRKKFPCDVRVWNPKKKFYEDKVVYRYMSKNLLALQIQVEVRDRFLAQYNEQIAGLTAQFPNKSRDEIDIELTRSERASSLDRQKSVYSKLSKFYNSQRFKNRKF